MSEAGRKPGENRLRTDTRRRMRMLKRRAAIVTAAVLLVAAGAIRGQFLPASSERRPVKVDVPRGSGVQGVAETLAHAGIIRSAMAFTLYVRLHGEAGHLKAGRYTLSADMTFDGIVKTLEHGPGRSGEERVRVTIPEGFTLQQIAAALGRARATDAASFEKLATTPANWRSFDVDFPLPTDTLEGYLYPDTYDFLPNTSPESVAQEMLLNFSRRFVRPKQRLIKASGRDLHAIVVMASLIEREAKVSGDRPRIAGVLDNRLNHNMRLEVDATVLYALGHHKRRVMDSDLRVDSPYNTYLHAGLPPGPIASPGLSSLDAALSPEKNDFLYYVARPTGEHLFSRSKAEHDAAVKQARAEWRSQAAGVQSDG